MILKNRSTRLSRMNIEIITPLQQNKKGSEVMILTVTLSTVREPIDIVLLYILELNIYSSTHHPKIQVYFKSWIFVAPSNITF